KTSAERKLSQTEEHLNRVEDILHEINNQLAPLEIQRKTALDFQEKKTLLSEIEIALTASEIERLNAQWQMSKRELADYDRKISMEEQSLAVTQAALKKLKQKLDACDEQL
ncbi:MAG TPA: hypothetical protein PLT73_08030, partial [Trichococcus flocculiformis]|nr:hypothetical protein [Trichococcus flocculiformis]